MKLGLGIQSRIFAKKRNINFFRLLLYSAWFESSEVSPKCGTHIILSRQPQEKGAASGIFVGWMSREFRNFEN